MTETEMKSKYELWRERNREKLLDYYKNYNKIPEHSEKIKRANQMICECCGGIKVTNKYNHRKSQKHLLKQQLWDLTHQ